jgi:hypothetical protein
MMEVIVSSKQKNLTQSYFNRGLSQKISTKFETQYQKCKGRVRAIEPTHNWRTSRNMKEMTESRKQRTIKKAMLTEVWPTKISKIWPTVPKTDGAVYQLQKQYIASKSL